MSRISESSLIVSYRPEGNCKDTVDRCRKNLSGGLEFEEEIRYGHRAAVYPPTAVPDVDGHPRAIRQVGAAEPQPPWWAGRRGVHHRRSGVSHGGTPGRVRGTTRGGRTRRARRRSWRAEEVARGERAICPADLGADVLVDVRLDRGAASGVEQAEVADALAGRGVDAVDVPGRSVEVVDVPLGVNADLLVASQGRVGLEAIQEAVGTSFRRGVCSCHRSRYPENTSVGVCAPAGFRPTAPRYSLFTVTEWFTKKVLFEHNQLSCHGAQFNTHTGGKRGVGVVSKTRSTFRHNSGSTGRVRNITTSSLQPTPGTRGKGHFNGREGRSSCGCLVEAGQSARSIVGHLLSSGIGQPPNAGSCAHFSTLDQFLFFEALKSRIDALLRHLQILSQLCRRNEGSSCQRNLLENLTVRRFGFSSGHCSAKGCPETNNAGLQKAVRKQRIVTKN